MSVMLIAFICYAFVDDNDVVHMVQDVYTTGEPIMDKMQKVQQEELLSQKQLLVLDILDLGKE